MRLRQPDTLIIGVPDDGSRGLERTPIESRIAREVDRDRVPSRRGDRYVVSGAALARVSIALEVEETVTVIASSIGVSVKDADSSIKGVVDRVCRRIEV